MEDWRKGLDKWIKEQPDLLNCPSEGRDGCDLDCKDCGFVKEIKEKMNSLDKEQRKAIKD